MPRNLIVFLMLVLIAFSQNPGVTARDLYLTRIGAKGKKARNFGVRYNLVQVDQTSQAMREVDPDSNFRSGDCVAIRLTPNRGGRLFVFNQGAAGTWQALLPSPLAPHEPNTVQADASRLIPESGCFLIDQTRGTEVLLVVVTEKDQDHYQLSEAAKTSISKALEPRPLGSREVAGGPGLVSRELSYQKIKTPQAPGEPPNSVYVASVEAAENDQIAIAIKIRHE